jgi:hypothetical protein
MFAKSNSTSTAVEAAPQIEISVSHRDTDLVPLSYLELDLPTPVSGWQIELGRRGIEILTDDIGRPSISRDAVRQLLDEQRENELRQREAAARMEAQAIEQDRQFRASLPVGQAWYDMPAGQLPASVMLQQAKDAARTRPTDAEWMFKPPGEITGGTFNGEDWS